MTPRGGGGGGERRGGGGGGAEIQISGTPTTKILHFQQPSKARQKTTSQALRTEQ